MSPTELEPHYRRRKIVRKRLHRAYVLQHSHVILVAMLFLVFAATFWVSPNTTSSDLGVQHPYDYFWSLMYTLGSLSIIGGVLTRRVGIEVAGHLMLVPGMVIHLGVALVAWKPDTGRLMILLALFIVGSIFRAYGLYAGWKETDD